MLITRPVEISDSAKLYYHLSNPRVVRFSRLKPASIEDMEKMIAELKVQEEERKVIPYAIVKDEEQVGMITLWDYCQIRREGFLSTWLGEDYWGKGLNGEAKILFLEKLFTQYKLDRVLLMIRNSNLRSIAACSKIDYVSDLSKEEELIVRMTYNHKVEDDHILFSINKKDFLDRK